MNFVETVYESLCQERGSKITAIFELSGALVLLLDLLVAGAMILASAIGHPIAAFIMLWVFFLMVAGIILFLTSRIAVLIMIFVDVAKILFQLCRSYKIKIASPR